MNAEKAQDDSIIRVSDLRQTYGKVEALKGLNFQVKKGEIFGLIGPDGAGKTTTFHLLAGIMQPTSGIIEVLGREPHEIRIQIGYLTQRFSLNEDLSVSENIAYLARLREIPAQVYEERRDKYLKLLSLNEFQDRVTRALSGGMKQKLALCCALVSSPQILLLDEPTTGVDPISRREFWDILATISGQGVTIVIATPYLDEAERCHRVALMYGGQIQQIGTPEELRADTPTESGQSATLEDVFVESIQKLVPPHDARGFEFDQSSGQRSSDAAIETRNLTKQFHDFKAVDNVNLKINYGTIYGLLGANGAGKTTTIKMICGLLERSSGDVILAGSSHDLRSPELRRRIGYMSQKFTLYEDLTIRENLEFYCGVYSVPESKRKQRIDWVLEMSQLQDQQDVVTASLPGGWRQRLSFGASVMHQPQILFLDEPTSGVDPIARRQLWRTITDFAKHGTAILVTTHFLDEAEHCHELGFMVAGRLVAQGSPQQIKSEQPGQLIEMITSDTLQSFHLLRQELEDWRVSVFGARLHLVLDKPDQQLHQARQLLQRNGIEIKSETNVPFSLEDAFIGIVKRQSNQQVAA